MALTFGSGTATLTSWGFGAGDIAVIAGAGRAVGNWLMAARKDQALLDFFAVLPEDILQRKGLVDVVALHKRWDQKLVLLKNGRRHTISQPGGAVVENMNSFTWFMTFMVAILDSAVSSRMVQTVVSRFLSELMLEKSVGGADYLLQEVSHHIQGWRSNGCVRSILQAAHIAWHRLAREGAHLPGNIPESDLVEILRLFVWIAAGKDRKFITASADVACLAKVFATLGLELLAFGDTLVEFDENRLVVVQSELRIPAAISDYAVRVKRRGVIVPWYDMEECVTLWPGISNDRNRYRCIFSDGAGAAFGVRLTVERDVRTVDWEQGEERDVYYTVEIATDEAAGRVGKAWRIIDFFLLSPTPHTARAVIALTQSWSPKAKDEIIRWVQDIRTEDDNDKDTAHLNEETLSCLTELEVFLLGYYYTVLRPLMNTSQLSLPEVYGSWGWNDTQILKTIRRFLNASVNENRHRTGEYRDPPRYPRRALLRLIAFFFAGADSTEQLDRLDSGSVGVLGKLAIFTASVLGGADEPDKVEKFWLLDIDPTCIPSNSCGIVTSGQQRTCLRSTIDPSLSRVLHLTNEGINEADYTAHIEPDWQVDAQTMLVAYRHHGRIVHRLSPVDTDLMVLKSWMAPTEPPKETAELERAIAINLKDFHGGTVFRLGEPTPEERAAIWQSPEPVAALAPSLIVFTGRKPNARACIVGMYRCLGSVVLCSNDPAKARENVGEAIIL